jgi:hypothetical protein
MYRKFTLLPFFLSFAATASFKTGQTNTAVALLIFQRILNHKRMNSVAEIALNVPVKYINSIRVHIYKFINL